LISIVSSQAEGKTPRCALAGIGTKQQSGEPSSLHESDCADNLRLRTGRAKAPKLKFLTAHPCIFSR
jgi:hypothetical protein